MSSVSDMVAEGGVVFAGTIDEAAIEALFESAIERCVVEADDRCIYISDCIDHLDRYRDYLPEPAEVREHLRDEDLGDWQAVVRATAYVAVREYLDQLLAVTRKRRKTAKNRTTERG